MTLEGEGAPNDNVGSDPVPVGPTILINKEGRALARTGADEGRASHGGQFQMEVHTPRTQRKTPGK